MAALALVCGTGAVLLGLDVARLLPLILALAALTLLGFLDDVRPLGRVTRLILQTVCCAIAVAGLPSITGQSGPGALVWIERIAMTLALVANVNFVSFVDGIDEITVAHAGPGLAAAALSCLVAPIAAEASLAAAAGLGALLGFWVWNRHPARIVLGHAGSLPVGLLLAWLALAMAASGFWAAGLLITLYPVVEAGLTLLRRLRAGAPLARPHRDHAYQRAVDTGIPTRQVAATVALVASAAAVLALIDLVTDNNLVNVAALAIGLAWIVFPIIGWLRRAGIAAPDGRSA
ncbi:glycosyl transferase [Phreatobacter sp.]|uniref:glycosyl transferase n=1 Tax=Phreatobacter sp. TaxID=1966341 RepID=UPI003F729767